MSLFGGFRNKSLMAGAVISIAMPFVAREEGLRTVAYLDSANVPTICYGETNGVKLGDKKTSKECEDIFKMRLGAISAVVDATISPTLPPETHAALTSWAYNVGTTAMRNSTLVKRANAGDLRGACDELLKWKFAAGKPILLKRRERERELCLSGL